MSAKPKPPETPAALRRRAERNTPARQSKIAMPRTDADAQRLLHALEVHQIELEMQNAELRLARDEADSVREKYTDLYDFAPVGYFTLTEDGTVRMVNLTGSTFVGMERSRLVGRSFAMLVSPGLRPAFHTFLKQVFEGEGEQSTDSALLCKGEADRFVTIKCHRAPDGRECNVAVVDITGRKRDEDMLRRNEALFSALIGQAPIGMYVVDSQFHLQQANPTALALFSKIHPLLGRDFSEIVHILWPKRAADDAVGRFRDTLKTGMPYQSPAFSHQRRDTRVNEVYEWQIQRVTLPAGEYGVVCFFNDITERIRAEAAQRRLEVMVASNEKLKQEIVRRQALEEVLHRTRAEETRLLTQSRKQELRLRDLSHQILHAQEEERKRISRELHDVIAQTLVGINVHVAALARETTDGPGSLQQKIASTHRMVEKAVDIVHQFARELRPTLLDDLGLIPALRTHLKGFMEETGIRVSLKAFAGIEKAPETIRTAFYRIAQEALANVANHANASAVEISIQSFAGGISMEITDDGEGFEVNENLPSKKKGRLGLLGMRERAEMIGGVFSVASVPGAATTVRVLVKRSHNGNKADLPVKSVRKSAVKRP